MTGRQLKELLKDMSLKEKINQLLQVTTGFFTDEAMLTGPVRESGITEENVAQAGSVIGLFGAEKYKKIQAEYMGKHPHHIPFLVMLDVINGFRTIYPIPLAQGAAFDPGLAEECAQMAAREAAVSGVHVTFSPMSDLVRDARWGRVMESTGEDPLLNSDYAAAAVRGYQGENIGERDRIAACLKHFAGYGAPEAGREYNTVELSENTLRGYYFPAYEAAVRAGVSMVMTSFNTLNGIPSTGNRWLTRDVLRGEMDFEGVLISDWAAIEELVYHGFAADRKQAAQLSMEAGVDIDMMTGAYVSSLEALVTEGALSEKLLDEAVLRVLTLKNRLGLFENPDKDADEEREKEVILCPAHRKLAEKAAERTFVLLENNGILPLKKGENIAFIGPYAEEKQIYGAWSMMGRAEDTVSIREAAESLFSDYMFSFAPGCPMLGSEELKLIPEHAAEGMEVCRVDEMLQEAAALAKKADKVVLCIGEDRLMSGEAASRADIKIPKVQRKLLSAVHAVNPNIAVVLFTGRPLDLREVKENASAILNVWMPGTEGGNAIMNVLTGNAEPGGRLPMSFPWCAGQIPVHYNEFFTGRPYSPSDKEKAYRSNYRDIPNEPLYPFGFGRSYTSFQYNGLNIDGNTLKKGESLYVSVTLTNTGEREGTETVQLYIRDCVGSVVRPKKELKAYQRITLLPGEEKKVKFLITEEMLRFCRADMTWGAETGDFQAFIGGDSTVTDCVEFRYE